MHVSINGMAMAYEEHGAGPAVLLLRGFPIDSCVWKTRIQPFALAGYRVIAPDLRGFGQSTAPPGDYSLDILGDDVIGLLDYLGIGRAAIVGASLGAHVLNILLRRYPQRVAAAVFVDPLSRKDGHAECERLLELLTKCRDDRRAESVDALAEVLPSDEEEAVRQWLKTADDRILALLLKTMREQTVVGPGGGEVVLPILRLRTGPFATRKGQDISPEPSKCTGGRSDKADCPAGSENGTEITRSLLDFFQGVKRFRPRCQIFRQVA